MAKPPLERCFASAFAKRLDRARRMSYGATSSEADTAREAVADLSLG
jgi:hypothetical protein